MFEWFDRYVDSFRDATAVLSPMQELKYAHSLRVAGDAREIARRLSWPSGRVAVAEAAGLLHDVGRFLQLARYGTMNDRRSVNHGELSADVLVEHRAQVPVADAAWDDLEASVRYHNLPEIQPGLPETGLELLRLVRDADKLDIFGVIHRGLADPSDQYHAELRQWVDVEGPPTPRVLAALEQGNAVEYTWLRSLTDLLLTQLHWVFDLNFSPSVRMFRERGVYERFAPYLPDDGRVMRAARQVRDYLDSPQLTRCIA